MNVILRYQQDCNSLRFIAVYQTALWFSNHASVFWRDYLKCPVNPEIYDCFFIISIYLCRTLFTLRDVHAFFPWVPCWPTKVRRRLSGGAGSTKDRRGWGPSTAKSVKVGPGGSSNSQELLDRVKKPDRINLTVYDGLCCSISAAISFP